MFHDFYQMLEEPFSVSPDPRFLYVAASHRESLASLYYGVETGRGLMVLIAPPGSGKTTLIHQLIGKLQPGARTVFLFQTQCTSSEMVQYLLNDLGVNVTGMDTVTMYNQLFIILTEEEAAGRRFVLIVDEAQNLKPDVLETIRLLSNFETSRRKLLQVLLVGQPELARKLANPALEHLQQRISICTRLQPFNTVETAGYIAHRLKVAGYSGSELFTPAALNMIEQRSLGIPRQINRLCFGALSLGFAMGRNQIDAEMMAEVVADLENEGGLGKPPAVAAIPPAKIIRNETPAARMLMAWRHLGNTGPAFAGVAALLLIAFGWLAYARGHIGHFFPARTAAVAPTVRSYEARTPVARAHTEQEGVVARSQLLTPATPPAVDNASTNASPPSNHGQEAMEGGDLSTVKVVVRPGETLQRIALRTLGKDNNRLIREIQELNPQLTNPDHIEADQEIRLPQVPPETPSVSR